jgi:glyoxylase-like metal-dependent hydrolase (beta-lactamase superfamily II)
MSKPFRGMSKPFRGMSKPQMTRLRPDIVLIEYSDTGAEEAHLSTNTYALVNAGRMLLLDTNVSSLLPYVRQLSDDGYSPAALVLSHRHVVGLGDAIGDLSTEFKIPVLLHPIDAVHQQAVASGIQFENPVGHPILGEFGFEAVLFPGQTAGSIVLHTTKRGGLLLTGDSAMGTTADQAKAGLERLVRPPVETSVDDAELREQWLAFDRPVATVLPFHGTGYIDRQAADIASIMHPLVRPEPTYWDEI